jgi:hypothetical protein
MWKFWIPFLLRGAQSDSKITLPALSRFQTCIPRRKKHHMRLPCLEGEVRVGVGTEVDLGFDPTPLENVSRLRNARHSAAHAVISKDGAPLEKGTRCRGSAKDKAEILEPTRSLAAPHPSLPLKGGVKRRGHTLTPQVIASAVRMLPRRAPLDPIRPLCRQGAAPLSWSDARMGRLS